MSWDVVSTCAALGLLVWLCTGTQMHDVSSRRVLGKSTAIPKPPATLSDPRATPWKAGPSWPWEDVPPRDLKGLLDAVTFGLGLNDANDATRVSCVLATSSLQSLLINWIYTLVTFGRSPSYLVAVLDETSLGMCRTLRLPCWDARTVLSTGIDIDGSTVHNHTANGTGYNKLVHAKPSLVLELLKHGYDVHFSDVDVVFVRDVWASFDALLDKRHADASFMREVWAAQGLDNVINSGHAVIRNNERTRAMYTAYAGGQQHRHAYTGDQGWLNNGPGLRTHVYDICDDAQACDAFVARGVAAIAPYSEQGGPWNPCVQQPQGGPIAVCSPWQVAIHFICMVGRETKLATMRDMGLLFVEEDKKQGVVRLVEQVHSMPCPGSPIARLHDYETAEE